MNTVPVLLSVSVLLMLAACTKPGGKTAETQPSSTANPVEEAVIPVKLAAVSTVVRAEPIIASGLVSSAEEARLSFKVGGIVSRLYVEEGQPVRLGQLLATLDLTEINAQVSQAQLASEKAERDFGRVKKLYADSAATLEQLQNATTGTSAARQNLTIAQFNRSHAEIRATVDGTVTQKLVNAGEYVVPGASVYQLSSNRPGDWVVRVGVSDKDWARLRSGNRATITLDAYPGRTFTGNVGKLAQAADPISKLYEVEVRISPGGVKLAPGLFARVTLTPAQSRSYTLVPVEAIVEGNGRDGFVYVLDSAKSTAQSARHVRKLPVQIGFLDGDKVLLTNGLAAASQVVTAGSAFLTSESTVVLR